MNTTLTRTRTTEQTTTDIQVSKGALTALGVTSILIGLWAIACFVGGFVATGGPLGLAKAWISAVTGL